MGLPHHFTAIALAFFAFAFLKAFFPTLLTISRTSSVVRTSTITQDGTLQDGQGVLVSPAGGFVLGFFSPGSSRNRYLGIWYSVDNSTIVWVANREKPVLDSSGTLNVTSNGRLVIYQGTQPLWSTGGVNSSVSPLCDVAAELLDTGNFVVRGQSASSGTVIIWQSFDYPTDTMLPHMKIGADLKAGFNRHLTSWKSDDDPAPGDYTYMMDSGSRHQIYLRSQATGDAIYRPGWWNGIRFSGNPRMEFALDLFKFKYVRNDDEESYMFEIAVPARLHLKSPGAVDMYLWDKNSRNWSLVWTSPQDTCDKFNRCGPNSICKNEKLSGWFSRSSPCDCLGGFRPAVKGRVSEDPLIYKLRCQRKVELDCSAGEWFEKVRGVKLPVIARNTVVLDWNVNLKECSSLCKSNCSCVAYAAANHNSRSGCILWVGDLIDIRNYYKASSTQDDLYVRRASGDAVVAGLLKKSTLRVIILLTLLGGIPLIILLFPLVMVKLAVHILYVILEIIIYLVNNPELAGLLYKSTLLGIILRTLPGGIVLIILFYEPFQMILIAFIMLICVSIVGRM